MIDKHPAAVARCTGVADVAACVEAAYGEETYRRLVELKRAWDPGNLFRVNQNVEP